MVLASRVHIARRFQKSVRIDSDIQELSALEGYVCPKSSAEVLTSMASHICETRHGAFTWTGPYGSGKSSLVVALGALLSSNRRIREEANKVLGKDTAQLIDESIPPKRKGWKIVPVVGRRDNPVQVIGAALKSFSVARRPSHGWSETRLIDALERAAESDTKTAGGIILFVDEMGKFLEWAAQTGGDVFIFQQLAEAANRSSGRLVVVGILHQAFDEYANRLARGQRAEWTKIQGRFVDLPLNVAGEEQLSLISRAIESENSDKEIDRIAKDVAACVLKQRPAASPDLSDLLASCWPLHPVVACLLGPISRRRFGQNQRSIFGFLNSAEPQGLQDFLRTAEEGSLYGPKLLWEYLQHNLEPSILASPDGHRWSLAVEAVQRCEALGGEETHLSVLKTIALIDLFRERSGLIASEALLSAANPTIPKRAVKQILTKLKKWSLIVSRRFAGDYVIFAGSDFDIESAVESALEEVHSVDLSALKTHANIHPILAKRHYHQYGTLRWFDVELASITELKNVAHQFEPDRGTIGLFILAIPTDNETSDSCQSACREAARLGKEWDIVVGLSPMSWGITTYAKELMALGHVRTNSPELAGDAVARREVQARIADVQGQVEQEIQGAFDNANWYKKYQSPKHLRHAELNSLASDLADARYHQSPLIHNELLNRIKPSANATAAQNILLRQMVLHEGVDRLGIEGYPAEGGLFASVLEETGIYRNTNCDWRFCQPRSGKSDHSNLAPLWKETVSILKKEKRHTVLLSAVYELWRNPPFGVQEGLMPILAVAFIQSQRHTLAFYAQGIFQTRLKEIDVEYLARDASDVQLRWMDLSDVSRRMLSGMASIVRNMDSKNALTDLEPIDVARGLISIFDNLPVWTKRTMKLSNNALQIRTIFKKANDPNKFLFDDLPELSGVGDLASEIGVQQLVEAVREGLEELAETYPTALRRLREATMAELQVPNTMPSNLAELRGRAENIRQLTGDYRLEAFISRIIDFDGSLEGMEGLASLAANKPPQDWTDPDIDRAAIELADLAQKFVRSEAFARVKGRKDKRQSMAVVVGVNGRPTPVSGEFDVTERDRHAIDELIERVEDVLTHSDAKRRNIILAALAEMSARYLTPSSRANRTPKEPAGVELGALGLFS